MVRESSNNGGGDDDDSMRPGHHKGGVIMMNAKQGRYHWKYATEKLEEELYDCNPDGFFQFMKSIKETAEKFGWSDSDGILSIAPNPKKP